MDRYTGWIYAVSQENMYTSRPTGQNTGSQNGGGGSVLPRTSMYRFKVDTIPWTKETIFRDADMNMRISAIAVSSRHKLIGAGQIKKITEISPKFFFDR